MASSDRRGRLRRPIFVDPGLRAGVVLAGVVVVGFAALALAWAGVAGTLLIPVQVPFLVSGGLGGIALAGAAAGLLDVHLERRAEAVERVAFDRIVRDAADLAAAVRREQPVDAPALVVLTSTVHRASCRVVAGRNDTTPMRRAPTADALRNCRICRPSPTTSA